VNSEHLKPTERKGPALAKVKPLHERKFSAKPLKSLSVYHDPFGENEICVELIFADGLVECVCIGSGKPQILSTRLCHEEISETHKSSNV
jgi:hypothetical protein